ncbi:MAG TPA: hypothetical protein VGM19_13535 [Armatimonadota bacterium]|jgi:hypothetical protein
MRIGVLRGIIIGAALLAAGLVVLGSWTRGRGPSRPPAGAGAAEVAPTEALIQAEPGGEARRLEVQLLAGSDPVWSPDGRTVALRATPGPSGPPPALPPHAGAGEIRKAVDEMRRQGQETSRTRVYLVDVATGKAQELPTPEKGCEVDAMAWWPDGRVLECLHARFVDESRGRSVRLWLVNPAGGRAEQVGEVYGFVRLASGPQGIAIGLDGDSTHPPYPCVLQPSAQGPVLTRLSGRQGGNFWWDSHGGLYTYGQGHAGPPSPGEGRLGASRVALPSATSTPVTLREPPERSTEPLSADEILMADYFPVGSATRAFYALNPSTGVKRRLTEALPETAQKPLARMLGGRWILSEQVRYRHSQPVYRVYGYSLAQGAFYPVTDWGPLHTLFGRYAVGPADELLLVKSPKFDFAAVAHLLSGSGRGGGSLPSLPRPTGSLWVLQPDEKRLLSQTPLGSDEWKVQPGEGSPDMSLWPHPG